MKTISKIVWENQIVNVYNSNGDVVMSSASFTDVKNRIKKLIEKGVYCKENFTVVYAEYLKSINCK